LLIFWALGKLFKLIGDGLFKFILPSSGKISGPTTELIRKINKKSFKSILEKF
jgi:hypothetical protein